MAPSIPTELLVLIESDWNLKTERRKIILQRIVRINRIRLEFKVALANGRSLKRQVLIESDWNLKQKTTIELA